MKTTKWMVILSVTIILSLFVVNSATAWQVQSVDGVWGNIDGVTTTSQGYPIDIIGSADNGSLKPTKSDQIYRLNSSICSPKQNINPPWPDTTRWTAQSDSSGFGVASSTCATAPSLFFSEYRYDSRTGSDYVVIEISNFTGAAVNLGDYHVHLFTGDRTFTDVPLNATSLANGSVYVIATVTNDITVENQTFADSEDYRTVVLVKDTGTATEGARCDRWATGPGNSPTAYSDWNPAVQSGPTTDENQVRYGRDAYNPANWQSYDCELTNFAQQSGFGFNGVDGPVTPTTKVPFFLGQFYHYNNQVFSTDNTGAANTANPFGYVDLHITVPIKCNDNVTTTSFSFDTRFTLDETSNGGTCAYSDPLFPNPTPCPDKVTVTQPITTGSFSCPDGTYTVNINGFTRIGLNEQACNLSFNPDAVSTEYITQEDLINTACLWATIDAPTADIAAAKTCQNFSTQLPFYRIVVTNAGPGASRQPELTDALPAGVDYDTTRASFLTSKLTTSGGTVTQGSCSVVSDVVTCKLLTPLPDYPSDNLAKWTVEIPVKLLATGSRVNTTTVTSATADPNLANNTATATCDSTSAALISFTAQAGETGTTVMWETSEELDNVGFNLYRSESVEGERVLLNSEIIPSQVMGQNSGAVYTFVDERSQAGKVYFYWLEDVDVYGETNVYGPVPNGQVYQFSPVEEIPTVIRP